MYVLDVRKLECMKIILYLSIFRSFARMVMILYSWSRKIRISRSMIPPFLRQDYLIGWVQIVTYMFTIDALATCATLGIVGLIVTYLRSGSYIHRARFPGLVDCFGYTDYVAHERGLQRRCRPGRVSIYSINFSFPIALGCCELSTKYFSRKLYCDTKGQVWFIFRSILYSFSCINKLENIVYFL